MTRENLTRWTCDRCGTQIYSLPTRKPLAWGGRIVADLPGMVNETIDLCNPCEVNLRHYLKQDPAWALWDRFTDLAYDYFSRPAGSSGNADRARLAREALKRLNDFEMDSTPFYEAGFFLGDPKDWATDGSLTGTPSSPEVNP